MLEFIARISTLQLETMYKAATQGVWREFLTVVSGKPVASPW